MSDWYTLEVDEATKKLEVDVSVGLTDAEARRRLAENGPNELIDRGTKNPWLILVDQFKDLMVIILLVAAVVSFFLSEELTDVIVIMAIVVLNAGIGFSQEYRAEQAIAALKKLAVPTVRVRRNGQLTEVSVRDLVPGDVVLLEAGNLVPADGRLVESINLKVEEAALTGESEPVEKHEEGIKGGDVPLGDQFDMVFMGTVVTYGRGTAVITGTGMNTELGKIADLIQGVEGEQTPLQRRLDGLGKSLAWIALAIIAVVIIFGRLRGEEWSVLVLTGISMAVAAVPEGLPAVVTITLALGSQRMLKRNALIRKLPAVETLGSVTVICSDKTGTLTENRMTVTILDVAGHTQDIETLVDKTGAIFDAELHDDHPAHERTLSLLVKAGALCNDAILQQTEEGIVRTIGDPTEGALVVAAAKLGHTKERMDERWPRVGEVPFTSERKRMTTIHKVNVGDDDTEAPWKTAPFVAFSKGGVDNMMEVSTHLWDGTQILQLDDALRQRILDGNARLAQQGQRVLGVAFRPLEAYDSQAGETVEADMIFIGLVAMIDPPRPEVRDAVMTARDAGIRPMMITGDHPLTAQQIAKELTITEQERHLTGRDLATMDADELQGVVHEISVYARVSPEHKLNIVNALQAKGEVVAMTGDGVNDAPALKKADIGVAMGITGTDVSKEAADMVLLDDNFATIVAAIEEGRKVYDNIRKFIKYTLSSNTGELFVMLAAPFLGMPLPLVPLQILWINLVTDGLPGLALAIEDSERGVMKRAPFRPNESIFSRGMGQRILWIGTLMGLISLLMGYLYWDPNNPQPHGTWQTMVFTTLTLAQMGNALAIRSNIDSLFSIGIFSNRLMLGSVLLTFTLQMLLVYVPFFQGIFNTVALSPLELAISLAASSLVFFTVELEKWVRRRRGA